MTLHQSSELRQVTAEAHDIAAQVGQSCSTAHLLLALCGMRRSLAFDLLQRTGLGVTQ